MYRILIAQCIQEISSFNPAKSHYEDFEHQSGEKLLEYHRGIESEIGGALEVFGERDDVELVPARGARAPAAGPLAS